MIDIEEQLSAGMRERAAGLALTSDVVGQATRRHRRRTALQRTAYAAGVVGLAGALAGAVTLGGPGSPTPPAGRDQPAVASADMRLASAIAASESTSYRVKVTNKSITTPGGQPTTTVGAFDPATDTGWLRSPCTEGPGWNEERLIRGTRYAGEAGVDRIVHWKRYPGKYDGLNYDGGLDGALSGSASPDELFKALRQAGVTVTETGTGTYHFKVSITNLPEGRASDVIEGDIRLDARNRVAQVEYERAVEYDSKGRIDATKWTITMELSGYGSPVKVEEPDVK